MMKRREFLTTTTLIGAGTTLGVFTILFIGCQDEKPANKVMIVGNIVAMVHSVNNE